MFSLQRPRHLVKNRWQCLQYGIAARLEGECGYAYTQDDDKQAPCILELYYECGTRRCVCQRRPESVSRC
jgi:hypothetical protein